jgi:hypothetical protein
LRAVAPSPEPDATKHLPRPARPINRLNDGTMIVAAQCACGVWGSAVPVGAGDPAGQLAVEHGCPEPSGCAACGEPTRYGRLAPWQRYAVERRDGVWDYFCLDRQVCEQRLLAIAAGRSRTDLDILDPLSWLRESAADFVATQDVSFQWLLGDGDAPTMGQAIALWHVAHELAPRRWVDVADHPNRRSFLASVTALEAIIEATDKAKVVYLLAARRAGPVGSSSPRLPHRRARAAGGPRRMPLRAWLRAKVQMYEWLNDGDLAQPQGEQRWQELQHLLEADDPLPPRSAE